MKTVWFFCVAVIVFTMVAVWGDQAKTWKEDINNDGIQEVVSYKEFTGGNNMWGKLRVSRQGKTVFSSDELCVTWSKQGYFLIDIDKQSSGKEIIIYKAMGEVAEYKADRFKFLLYSWQKGRYVSNKILFSTGKYQTGEEAKKEMVRRSGEFVSVKVHTYPYSTELAGVRCQMTIKEVVSRLGKDCFKCSASSETQTWCVAYNDPSGKGSLLIDTGSTDKKSATRVSGIFLATKTIPGAPKARVSFCKKGTASGIKLGDSLGQAKKVYPGLRKGWWPGTVYYTVDVASSKDWPCFIGLWFTNDKVEKIFSGYMP